jgi:nicotinate-nucleotide adenylyltransferase
MMARIRRFAQRRRPCYRAAMASIGLLGGSFNPAHRAHRRISLAALEALGLDEIWWLASPGNPLKPARGMAPLAARFASAVRMARHAPIRVTAIERELGTVFTAETLAALARRFPQHRFVWLMGADNLAQFHRWRDWRRIARTMTIAVATRPGYDARALKAPAWGWLRRFVRPVAMAKDWTLWRPPALVLLKSPPDPTSATAIRAANPDWRENATNSFQKKALRDRVTRRPIS